MGDLKRKSDCEVTPHDQMSFEGTRRQVVLAARWFHGAITRAHTGRATCNHGCRCSNGVRECEERSERVPEQRNIGVTHRCIQLRVRGLEVRREHLGLPALLRVRGFDHIQVALKLHNRVDLLRLAERQLRLLSIDHFTSFLAALQLLSRGPVRWWFLAASPALSPSALLHSFSKTSACLTMELLVSPAQWPVCSPVPFTSARASLASIYPRRHTIDVVCKRLPEHLTSRHWKHRQRHSDLLTRANRPCSAERNSEGDAAVFISSNTPPSRGRISWCFTTLISSLRSASSALSARRESRAMASHAAGANSVGPPIVNEHVAHTLLSHSCQN